MTSEIKRLCISQDTPIVEAMQIINNGVAQIALVVDQQLHLEGTLTDGDIRRGILKGYGLDAPVGSLMNRQFRSSNIKTKHEELVKLMVRETLHQLPILDDQGKVVKILLLDELLHPKELTNNVVIMAGGKGTRLRP